MTFFFHVLFIESHLHISVLLQLRYPKCLAAVKRLIYLQSSRRFVLACGKTCNFVSCVRSSFFFLGGGVLILCVPSSFDH